MLGSVRLREVVGADEAMVTFAGQHQELLADVLVRVLRPTAANTPQARRFISQVRAWSRLSDPCFVRVLEASLPPGPAWVVQERPEGQCLRAILDAGRLDSELVVRITRSLARVLAIACQRGVIQGEVDPRHVFVSADGELELASSSQSRLTDEAGEPPGDEPDGLHVVGSPHYAAPERILGLRADQRADMYALGVLLFEMLAGQRPFDDPSSLQVLRKHVREAPPLQYLPPATPPRLRTLVARLLEKRPDKRPLTWESIAAELDAVVDRKASSGRLLQGLKRLLPGGGSA